jgi:predicted GNAT superfamily acetyltransferase
VAHDPSDAPRINRIARAGDWPVCADVDLDLDARRLMVEIPMGFTEMLAGVPTVALEWRLATRRIFTTYFGRGYRGRVLPRPRRRLRRVSAGAFD